jgi:hypothetical protein
MRPVRIPVVLALAAAAVAGSSTPADARTPLVVEVDCAPGDLSFSCDAVASGGATPYLYYYWTVTEYSYYDVENPSSSQVSYQYQVSGSSPTLSTSCTANRHVVVSVRVLDSVAGEDTGSSAFGC